MRSTLKPHLKEVGNLEGKLCVVIGYDVAYGIAYVNFRGFNGNAVLPCEEIQRAGWSELYWGNFLVCDIEQRDGKTRATNAREAVADDFE